MKPGKHLVLSAAALVSMGTSMTGCSRLTDLAQILNPSAPSVKEASIQLGKAAFPFDANQAISLSIAKASPETADRWSARVERKPLAADQTLRDSDPWLVTSYSGSSSLEDRLANRGWILHFLETMSTFRADSQMSEKASNESTIANFGFSPPRYAIQWQALNPATKRPQSFEIQIGAAVDFEKNPDGEAFTIFPPSKEIYQANGAALMMLHYLKSFSSLRQEALSTLESSDIQEISVLQHEKKILQAKRDGDLWKDDRGHKIGSDVSGFLDFMTHLRIEKFIDAPLSERQPLLDQLKTPEIKVVFKDRYLKPVEIAFIKVNGAIYATETARADSVFEMYPETIDRIRQCVIRSTTNDDSGNHL